MVIAYLTIIAKKTKLIQLHLMSIHHKISKNCQKYIKYLKYPKLI